MTTIGDLMGSDLVEDFSGWDYSEIHKVLSKLEIFEAIDLSHAEMLQQQALRGADIVCEYLSKIVKTVSYLESKINSAKNKAALEFKPAEGQKATGEFRKLFGESAPEVEELSIKLARAKGVKILLEKKYDILIRSHYHYKEIAQGMRRAIPTESSRTVGTGWE